MRTTINFSAYTLNIEGLGCAGITVDGDAVIIKTRSGYACIELDPDQMKDLRKKLKEKIKAC
mgnify:CR=1 FL=1